MGQGGGHGARLRATAALLLLLSFLGPASAILPSLRETAPACCRNRCCCNGGAELAQTCLRGLCTCGDDGEVAVALGGPPAILAPLAPQVAPPVAARDRFSVDDDRDAGLPPSSLDHPPPAARC